VSAGPPAGDLVLVLNCGSSSIKFALFDATTDPPPRVPAWSGQVRGIGSSAPEYIESGSAAVAVDLDAARPSHSALEHIRRNVSARLGSRGVAAVGHRVVHGGSKYSQPVRIDAAVLADLERYIPLAPLHQPFALEAIELILTDSPALPQVACFDTAFHRTQPRVEQMLPLSLAAWDRGIRRYGFHGLSYAYMAIALDERHGPAARGRTIVGHVGSGASLCAMNGLESVATTMGFSALDGLMMGTRCGALDAGVVLHMMEVEKLSPQRIGQILYQESGLLGVSGISADPRVLLRHEATDERARDAMALYVHRMVREIGALAAVLGGLDMLVFTAGVGENNAEVRRRVCARLGFLGVALDEPANARHAPVISAARSAVIVGVEPTNEEWIIAGQAGALT
jgi:acetate kinase